MIALGMDARVPTYGKGVVVLQITSTEKSELHDFFIYAVGFSFAHEKGNVFQWMEYVGCNGARSFMTINGDWRTDGASQFGKDFNGNIVGSRDAYISATRQLSSQGRSGNFFDWLFSRSEFDWKRLLNDMDDDEYSQEGGLRMGRAGKHSFYLNKLNELGYNVMGLWDIRCRTLEMKSILEGTEEYWSERWEEYKLFYIGGHWLADHGVDTVELYNEPDRDKVKYGCIDETTFVDIVRIRSAAIERAYKDKGLDTTIIAGTMTIAWRSDLSSALANNWWSPFPEQEEAIVRAPTGLEGSDDSYEEDEYYQPDGPTDYYSPNDIGYDRPIPGVSSIGDIYAIHDYGSFSTNSCSKFAEDCRHENGYALAKQRNRALVRLREKGLGRVPIWITETNCYTASQSDKVGHAYFEGKHVVENSATAACLASQFSGLYKLGASEQVPYVNVHKLIQTQHSQMPSGVAKNGVLFANLIQAPYHVGDSSKTGESLRQICKKTVGAQSVYGFTSYDGQNVNEKMNRFNVWTVQKNDNSHIFVINDHWVGTSISINVQDLNGDPNAPYSVTTISDYAPYDSVYHGEVSQVGTIGDNRNVEIGIAAESFSVITIPSVPVRQDALVADRDATFHSSTIISGYEPSIRVSTNGRDTSVGMFNFDLQGRNTVGAVLELHLERATNSAPQVLQVLGWNREWNPSLPKWAGASIFTEIKGETRQVKDNFINWDDDQVTVVGHVTVPPGDKIPTGGMKLRVDVSDTIGKVSNYVVLRPVRYDASSSNTASKLPADSPEGEYFFASIEAGNGREPKLLVNVRV